MAKKRMKRKAAVKSVKNVKKSNTRTTATSKPQRKRAGATDPLFAAVKGATHRSLGHVRLDVGRAGDARVKRMIYPPDSAGQKT